MQKRRQDTTIYDIGEKDMSYCSIVFRQKENENYIHNKSMEKMPNKKYMPDNRAATLRFMQTPAGSGNRQAVVRF